VCAWCLRSTPHTANYRHKARLSLLSRPALPRHAACRMPQMKALQARMQSPEFIAEMARYKQKVSRGPGQGKPCLVILRGLCAAAGFPQAPVLPRSQVY